MQSVLERVRGGEDDPSCATCGGILKSDTISFGQSLVPAVIESAMRSAGEADCLIAVGTSLQVYPIAAAVPNAQAAGAAVIIVNAQPTPFDDIAAVRFSQPISEVLPAMCCA